MDKRERSMIREALRRDSDRTEPFLSPEPRALRAISTEAYAIAQAERHAAKRRLLREAIARRVPAQNAGDSMAGLQMPKKAV